METPKVSISRTEAISFPTEIAYGVHNKVWEIGFKHFPGEPQAHRVQKRCDRVYQILFPGFERPDTSSIPVGFHGWEVARVERESAPDYWVPWGSGGCFSVESVFETDLVEPFSVLRSLKPRAACRNVGLCRLKAESITT